MPDPARVLRRTGQFKWDVKRAVKQGRRLDRLRVVVEALLAGEPLAERHLDHALVGGYRGSREHHVEPTGS